MPLTIPKTLRWKKPSKTPVKTKKATKVKPRTVKVKKTAVKPKTVVVKPKKQTVKATKTPVKTKKATKVKPRTVKVKKTAVKPVSAVPKAIKPTKATEVRMWYYTAYPDDDQWETIRPKITFSDVMDCLKSGEDFYTYVGNDVDSIIRERIFMELATLYGVDYDRIYNLWLKGTNKPKYVPTPPKAMSDDDLMKEMIIQHMKNPEKSSDFVKEHFIIARVPPANPTPQKSIKKKTAAKVKPVKKKPVKKKPVRKSGVKKKR